MTGPLHTRPAALAAVALGGLLGTFARYQLGVLFPQTSGHFPLTTFAVNMIGAFALGLLLEALARSGPDTGHRRRLRLFAGTGVLGSFTTYSSLAVETDLLLDGGHPTLALGYAAGTLAVGLAATIAGIAAGTRVRLGNGQRA
ncbi:FluC/FEX family fluoride channel [Nocardia thailandica]